MTVVHPESTDVDDGAQIVQHQRLSLISTGTANEVASETTTKIDSTVDSGALMILIVLWDISHSRLLYFCQLLKRKVEHVRFNTEDFPKHALNGTSIQLVHMGTYHFRSAR